MLSWAAAKRRALAFGWGARCRMPRHRRLALRVGGAAGLARQMGRWGSGPLMAGGSRIDVGDACPARWSAAVRWERCCGVARAGAVDRAAARSNLCAPGALCPGESQAAMMLHALWTSSPATPTPAPPHLPPPQPPALPCCCLIRWWIQSRPPMRPSPVSAQQGWMCQSWCLMLCSESDCGGGGGRRGRQPHRQQGTTNRALLPPPGPAWACARHTAHAKLRGGRACRGRSVARHVRARPFAKRRAGGC